MKDFPKLNCESLTVHKSDQKVTEQLKRKVNILRREDCVVQDKPTAKNTGYRRVWQESQTSLDQDLRKQSRG